VLDLPSRDGRAELLGGVGDDMVEVDRFE